MTLAKLPEAELTVMGCVWEVGGAVTSAAVADKLGSEKNWSYTTILTFLSRLAEKGFLKVYKEGKLNVYEPLVRREDYVENESRSFIEKIHAGSVTNLVACLYGAGSINSADLEELRRYINER